jgi:hypothetical protein
MTHHHHADLLNYGAIVETGLIAAIVFLIVVILWVA